MRGACTILVLGAVLFGAGVSRAQSVQFLSPEVGDRKVTLRWNKAPSDTISIADRQNCKELCGSCCYDTTFGGYQIWRGLSPDPSTMILLRTYSVLDTTVNTEWTFRADERVFVDPDSIDVRGCGGVPGLEVDFCDPLTGKAVAPFNGFRYWYAVTWFDASIDSVGGVARVDELQMQDKPSGTLNSPVSPAAVAVVAAPVLGDVIVVPNPYDPSDEFGRQSFRGEARIQFIHLPSAARLKIFTVAGDLIRELENTDSDDTINWDLKNGNGEDVVAGIYMYVAETGDGKQQRDGHFVVIR